MTAAAVLMVIYVTIALLDGLYLHFWKYKLYSRLESIYEHKLHTLRSVFFPFILYLLFAKNFGGVLLWIGISLSSIDLIVGALDIFAEKDSRRSLGGLSTFEYFLHVMAESVHFTYLALILVAKPADAWGFSASVVLDSPYPQFMSLVFWGILPGAVGAAVLHVWLLQRKYLTS